MITKHKYLENIIVKLPNQKYKRLEGEVEDQILLNKKQNSTNCLKKR